MSYHHATVVTVSLDARRRADKGADGRVAQVSVDSGQWTAALGRSPRHDADLAATGHEGATAVAIARVLAQLSGTDHPANEKGKN